MAKSKTWADYELPNLQTASLTDIRAAVRKAAKAANQRLVRLERAGFTDKYIYKQAMADLVNRKRFTEWTKNLNRGAAVREYNLLRSFLSAKGSTVKGLKEGDLKRYNTAKEHGFTGTFDEFYELINKYYAEHVEEIFDSDTIYKAITEAKTMTLDKIIGEIESRKTKKAQDRLKGRALLRYLELSEKEDKKRERKNRKDKSKVKQTPFGAIPDNPEDIFVVSGVEKI